MSDKTVHDRTALTMSNISLQFLIVFITYYIIYRVLNPILDLGSLYVPIDLSHKGVINGLAALGLWTSWYTWRFTLRPMFNPNDVKELPYYVPCKTHQTSPGS